MNRIELEERLRQLGVREDVYYLQGGNPPERHCIEVRPGGWAVYYAERGAKTSEVVYETEDEACRELLRRIQSDEAAMAPRMSPRPPVDHLLHPRPSFDPAAAAARIAELQARVRHSAAGTKAMAEQLGALRVSARDDRELVEATIDSNGILIELRVLDPSSNRPPDEIVLMVMEAVTAAKTRLAGRAREVVATTIGADSQAGYAVLASLDERLAGKASG